MGRPLFRRRLHVLVLRRRRHLLHFAQRQRRRRHVVRYQRQHRAESYRKQLSRPHAERSGYNRSSRRPQKGRRVQVCHTRAQHRHAYGDEEHHFLRHRCLPVGGNGRQRLVRRHIRRNVGRGQPFGQTRRYICLRQRFRTLYGEHGRVRILRRHGGPSRRRAQQQLV